MAESVWRKGDAASPEQHIPAGSQDANSRSFKAKRPKSMGKHFASEPGGSDRRLTTSTQ